jgi:hypothetical protein
MGMFKIIKNPKRSEEVARQKCSAEILKLKEESAILSSRKLR